MKTAFNCVPSSLKRLFLPEQKILQEDLKKTEQKISVHFIYFIYMFHLYVYVCVIYNYVGANMGHYMKWFFFSMGCDQKRKKLKVSELEKYSRYFILFCIFHFHGTAISVDTHHWTLLFLSSQFIAGNCCLTAKSCLTLCNTMDCSLSDFFVYGISQARILQWAATPSSRESS